MQDKDEAEWILERLFERLEESMRRESGPEALFSKAQNESRSSSPATPDTAVDVKHSSQR